MSIALIFKESYQCKKSKDFSNGFKNPTDKTFFILLGSSIRWKSLFGLRLVRVAKLMKYKMQPRAMNLKRPRKSMREKFKLKFFLARDAAPLPWRGQIKALMEALLDLTICFALGSHWFENLARGTNHALMQALLFK